MLIKLNDAQMFDSADLSMVTVIEPAAKPVSGAAFDFKPDTVLTFKNGQTMRVMGKSAEEIYDLIQYETDRAASGRVRPDGEYNFEGAMEDVLKELRAIREHVHTTSEMITRLVMTPQ